MPAGNIGPNWASGSWRDTAWEAGSWGGSVGPDPLLVKFTDESMSASGMVDIAVSSPRMSTETFTVSGVDNDLVVG